MTLLRRPSSPFFEQDSVSTCEQAHRTKHETRVENALLTLKTRRRRASSPMFKMFFLCRAAVTCAQPRAVSKRLRCTGDRMCHRTRVLQGWYRQTGDEVLQERARVCDGRCIRGRRTAVVGAFLGYHAPGCPLRQERNTSAHKLRAACCHEVDRSKAP